MSLESKILSPQAIAISGLLITLGSLPFFGNANVSYTALQQTNYTGPEIGDASNPLSGKMASNGKDTVRVDLSDDKKSIVITDIKTDEDRKQWLSEQRDRPPTVAMIANTGDLPLKPIIENQTTYWSAQDDKNARADFVTAQSNLQDNVKIEFAKAGAVSAIGITLCVIGAIKATRKR